HQPAGVLHAAFLRKPSDYKVRGCVPGKRRRARGKVAAARKVQERRQQALLADLARVHNLRNCEQIDFRYVQSTGARLNLRKSQSGISGAEINADDVFWFQTLLLDLNFRRRKNRRVLLGGERRQINLGSPPAFVTQYASRRRAGG